MTALFRALLFVALASVPVFAQFAQAEEEKIAAIPRITQSDFKAILKAGDVIIVDVRDRTGYESGHIPGAVWMPPAEWEKNWRDFPKNKPVVTYCS